MESVRELIYGTVGRHERNTTSLSFQALYSSSDTEGVFPLSSWIGELAFKSMAACYLRRSCFVVVCLVCCCASHAAAIPEDSLHLVPNIDYIGGTLTLWQVPEGPVKKILLILGGANINPYTYWDTSPSCPLCSGGPECRKITLDALARDYVVVVPKWNDGGFEGFVWPDPLPVLSWFQEWREVQGLSNVPTVALGISLGGEVMGVLPTIHPGLFESIAFMVAAPSKNTFKGATSDYPPSIFVHMPKDERREKHILQGRSIFNRKGIPTLERPWYQHPITANWFSQSVVGLNLSVSINILNALKKNGLLDEEDFVISDFAGNRQIWRTFLESWHVLPNDNRHDLADGVCEEIKVAFAYHTTISRMNDDLFRWFDGGYKDLKSCVSIALS